MKKLISAFLVLGSFSAFSATTGDLILSGSVAPTLSMAITASGNTNLDIVGGETAKQVATVAEHTNDADGYTISAYSVNGGKLINDDNSSVQVAYTLKYDGGSDITLGAGSGSATVVKNSGALTQAVNDTSAVQVSLNSYPGAPSGTYSDTVTFTIQAN